MAEIKRVNVNLSVELLQEVDDFAEKMRVTRTGAISFLLTTAINGFNSAQKVADLNALIEKLNISKDSMKSDEV